ncbi:serine protease, partial [Chaetomium sp. MPI-SDFR-AT-0129]
MHLVSFLPVLCGWLAFPLVLATVPILNNDVSPDLVVPNRYIVKYKDAVADKGPVQTRHERAVHHAARAGGTMKGVLDIFALPGLRGYIVEISPSELGNLVESDLLEYIEKDTITTTAAITPTDRHSQHRMMTQYDAPRGLVRLSHRSAHTTSDEYHYAATAGRNIPIYVLDSGIRTTHSEFHQSSNPNTQGSSTTRARWGANFIPSSPDVDEDGHGTHVAGIIAGTTYGVAKHAHVIAVKVLDATGSGSMSGVLQGLDWAVKDARDKGVMRRAVVNFSLAGVYTQSVNDAVQAAVEQGMTVVAAAGNTGEDAGGYSPGSAAGAITVGAVNGTGTTGEGGENRRATFSNWGAAVDIFAEGVAVLSAGPQSDTHVKYMSGTSMAAPHVAGLAAYFIAEEGLEGQKVKERV